MSVEAVHVREHGGPEVLVPTTVELDPPGPGEARVLQAAVGLNFIDVYHRTGLYPGPPPPFVPGVEGAGVVEEVGPGVTAFAPGDRVAYAGELGAYCAARNVGVDRLVPLPDAVDPETAAAVTLKGLTAWYLVRECRPLAPGDRVLVHAAAGGVGLLLCAWAAHLGARVIGTAGTEEKRARAREAGCEVVLAYDDGTWPERVRAATGGAGVDVAYDSVGAATFQGTLDGLARRGTFVAFGNASGPPPAVEPLELMRRGSLVFTRPSLKDFVATPEALRAGAEELYRLVAEGTLPVSIGARRLLAEAAGAHSDLEARRTSGSTVLLPAAAGTGG